MRPSAPEERVHRRPRAAARDTLIHVLGSRRCLRISIEGLGARPRSSEPSDIIAEAPAPAQGQGRWLEAMPCSLPRPKRRKGFMTNRRAFLYTAAGAVAGALLPSAAKSANEAPPMSAQAALKNLMDGNARFVAGTTRARASLDAVTKLASGQHPFATVLGCADSRVPVETVFDHDPGDIFVVRLAGNFVSDAALGSIEYATAVLKSPLIMVLGHASCGAVKAAIDFVKTGKPLPGHMNLLAEAIAPAAKASEHTAGDWWHNAIAENVRENVRRLRASTPILSEAAANGEVEIV